MPVYHNAAQLPIPVVERSTTGISCCGDGRMHGAQRRQLHAALLSAFPSEGALTLLVDFYLDVKLSQITSGPTLMERVYQLIQWAEAHDQLADLLKAAATANPSNSQLQAAAAELAPLLEARPPPAPPQALAA